MGWGTEEVEPMISCKSRRVRVCEDLDNDTKRNENWANHTTRNSEISNKVFAKTKTVEVVHFEVNFPVQPLAETL